MASKAKHAERSHYSYQKKAPSMSGYVRKTGTRARAIAETKKNNSLAKMLAHLSNLAPNKNKNEKEEKDGGAE